MQVAYVPRFGAAAGRRLLTLLDLKVGLRFGRGRGGEVVYKQS